MNKTLLLTFVLLGTSTLHAELFTEHFKDGVVKSQIEYVKGTRTDVQEGIKDGLEKYTITQENWHLKSITFKVKETVL